MCSVEILANHPKDRGDRKNSPETQALPMRLIQRVRRSTCILSDAGLDAGVGTIVQCCIVIEPSIEPEETPVVRSSVR